MFRKIVVGVDDGAGGRDAAALAGELTDRDGQVALAHVLVSDPLWWGQSEALGRVEQERADALLDRVREECGDAMSGVKTTVQKIWSSSVGRGLHVLAEGESADLIVLGSSRRGLIGRVLLGDDTRAALNGAPCAVAVAPAGYGQRPHQIRSVGVGYDGSPESRHALEVAKDLAQKHEAQLSACTAVSIPLPAFGPGPLPLSDMIENLERVARQRISALGVEPLAVYGETVEVLASYSTSLDLLVVGSRGYGPIGRLVHGSTSNGLARTAHCPTLILPRTARSSATETDARDRPHALPTAGS